MKPTSIAVKFALAAALFGVTGAAQATIINIDGHDNVIAIPLLVPLQAGSYTATILDGLNDGNPTSAFTAWSFASGNPDTWETNYIITLEDGTNLFGGTFTGQSDSAQAAFDATVAAGDLVFAFTVPTAQTVEFSLLDNINFDNIGGVSLNVISQVAAVPVPAPATLPLLAFGLAAVAMARRTRRRAC